MIDLNTGRIEMDGVIVEPQFTLEELKQYYPDKVDIFKRGEGRGIIRLKNWINSNGIDAQIKIEIDEKSASRRVIITPSLEGQSCKGLLEASKQWLKGNTQGNYEEYIDSISGRYVWGYISARYREDRDYGIVGGEIVICYEKQ